MRRFLYRVLLFFLIPVIGLMVLYLVTDPYKTLKPFSLQYFDTINRDYFSTELFLMNERHHEYNSFIFSSSRGCGLNTYHWKKYLDENDCQFLFQSWGETLTGIEQKVAFLDDSGQKLKNILILIDIPGTFSHKQIPTEAMSIKDPAISGQPKWLHQLILFYDYLQKPTQWTRAVRHSLSQVKPSLDIDTLTNDWNKNNRFINLDTPPDRDSLKNYSSKKRIEFLTDVALKSDADIVTSEQLITEKHKEQLAHIKSIFDKNNTNYRIIITPGYCYMYPTISSEDLTVLNEIFGADMVHNYSGKNDFTSDYNNYSDPNHFSQYIGWMMIEDIFNPHNKID